MRISSDRGYSLLEVLLGLLIFTIGALASGMLIVAGMNQNRVAKERSVAAGLVSEKLEELRDLPWDGYPGYSLKAGGKIVDDEGLRKPSYSESDYSYSDSYNVDLSNPADPYSEAPFYLVMWEIQDMTDSGLDFKRITIRGVSMNWHTQRQRWEPAASFDHVAMIFREIKTE